MLEKSEETKVKNQNIGNALDDEMFLFSDSLVSNAPVLSSFVLEIFQAIFIVIINAKLMELSLRILNPIIEILYRHHTCEDTADVDKLFPVVIEAPLAFEEDEFFQELDYLNNQA